jgi:hypothetical protein
MRNKTSIVLDSFNQQFSSASLFEGGSNSKIAPEKKDESITLPLSKFYGILNKKNKILLGMAFFSSFAAGLLTPSIAVFFGSVTGSFDPRNGTSIDKIMTELLKKIFAVAMCLWFLGYLQYAFMQ